MVGQSRGTSPNDAVRQSADAIRRHWPATPTVGIILGTGLSQLADEVRADVVIPFDEIPTFPPTTALSHRGRLICGRIGNATTVVMDGRWHLYEGYDVETITLPVRMFGRLGVKQLIVSNASGGLNPQYRSGDIMVIDDHLDLTWRLPSPEETGSGTPRPIRVDRYYDEGLIRQVLGIARRRNISVQRGVYAALTGPNYETRAEYRMLRRLGADVVGMSTVPEAVAAASLGMRVLAMSVVTNVATPDSPIKTSAEDVVALAERAGGDLEKIVRSLLE